MRLISGAADSSFADAPKGKTTLGFCIKFCDNLVEYDTKMSTRVLDSSTDGECNSLVLLGHSNSWWRDLLKEFGLFTVNAPTEVKEDNSSAIILTGHGSARRSRHFDIAFYKLKDTVQFGDLELIKVPTAENEADFFTKCLPPHSFLKHRATLMGSLSDQTYFERQSGAEDEKGLQPREVSALMFVFRDQQGEKGAELPTPRRGQYTIGRPLVELVEYPSYLEVDIPELVFSKTQDGPPTGPPQAQPPRTGRGEQLNQRFLPFEEG